MANLMKSISGVRGIVGDTLTPGTIVQFAAAFGEYSLQQSSRPHIIIGRDGRITGKIIGNLVSSTLLSLGCDVTAIGVCPTPTVQLAVEQSRATGGIVITASHNPIEWNGLKFVSSTGLFFNEEENKALFTLAEKGQFPLAPWNKIGNHRQDSSFLEHHIDAIFRLSYLDVEKIRRRKFKVITDCVNGAGGVIIPRLLKALGCTVIEMNCDASGIFAHPPEPLSENLKDLCQRVVQEKANLGIAVDPDVDRLVLITEQGEPFGEEYTVTSCVKFVLQKESASGNKNLNVCVNLSTTRAVDDVARQFNANVIRTPVGEINVAQRMKASGAVIGGEGSGGVILPKVHLGRDAAVGIALTLQHLLEFGDTMSALKASLPAYYITKRKIELRQLQSDNILRTIAQKYSDGKANTEDGLKLDFEEYWVHLRKSNTEPIIRVIAEARSKEQAEKIVKKFADEIHSLL